MCLHGFTDTRRAWELVLPALERRHDVLAPTLAGHAGGPRLDGPVDDALAPAGGWSPGDPAIAETLDHFATMQELLAVAAPRAEEILATPEGRRRATLFVTSEYEHILVDLLAHVMRGAARCDAVLPLLDHARRTGCSSGRARPPASAPSGCRTPTRVELDGVGHCPQLDLPAATADLILGFTAA